MVKVTMYSQSMVDAIVDNAVLLNTGKIEFSDFEKFASKHDEMEKKLSEYWLIANDCSIDATPEERFVAEKRWVEMCHQLHGMEIALKIFGYQYNGTRFTKIEKEA